MCQITCFGLRGSYDLLIWMHHLLILYVCFKETNAERNLVNTGSKKWRYRRVLLLWRGVHYGSYKGRGRSVSVDATVTKVIENHQKLILESLEKSGANVTSGACTYHSPMAKEWLRNSAITGPIKIVPWKLGSHVPNELIIEAYDLITLISIRADIFMKKSIADATKLLDLTKLGFAWKEANGVMSKHCMFRTSSDTSKKCLYAWSKYGERYADAIVVTPINMVEDLRFAVHTALSKFKVKWDQHSSFQHLKKLRGYSPDLNVSLMLKGFWNSNTNTHSNPIFNLVRHKSMSGHHASPHHNGGGHRRHLIPFL